MVMADIATRMAMYTMECGEMGKYSIYFFRNHSINFVFTIRYKHGKGTWTYVNGDVYVGDWENGCKHGHGVWTILKNSDKYVGQFFNDMRNGKVIQSTLFKRTYLLIVTNLGYILLWYWRFIRR
jgi:hypothetical protein